MSLPKRILNSSASLTLGDDLHWFPNCCSRYVALVVKALSLSLSEMHRLSQRRSVNCLKIVKLPIRMRLRNLFSMFTMSSAVYSGHLEVTEQYTSATVAYTES